MCLVQSPIQKNNNRCSRFWRLTRQAWWISFKILLRNQNVDEMFFTVAQRTKSYPLWEWCCNMPRIYSDNPRIGPTKDAKLYTSSLICFASEVYVWSGRHTQSSLNVNTVSCTLWMYNNIIVFVGNLLNLGRLCAADCISDQCGSQVRVAMASLWPASGRSSVSSGHKLVPVIS